MQRNFNQKRRFFMKSKKGFMLIELSIALVVIGLLFAGVSGGTALIENAKVRATLSQIEGIKNAANMFNAEFGLPPGGLTDTLNQFPSAIFTGGAAVTDMTKATCDRSGILKDIAAEGTGNTAITGTAQRGTFTSGAWSGAHVLVSTIAMCQLHAGRYLDLPTGSKIAGHSTAVGKVVPGEHAPKMKLSGSSSIILIADTGSNFTITLGDANLGTAASPTWDGTHAKIAGNISGVLLKKLDQKLSTGDATTGTFTAKKATAAGANACVYSGTGSKEKVCVATLKIIE